VLSTITNSNNSMSRRVHPTSKEPKAACCHICERAGESSQMVASHNFRDTKGRVVCPIFVQKLKKNRCHRCDQTGHFADKCPNSMVSILARLGEAREQKEAEKPAKKEAPAAVQKVAVNQWDVLGMDSSDEEEEEAFAKVAPNVTVRGKVKVSKRNWAEMSDDEEDDVLPANAPWAKK
jgi:hypothetical protein